MIPWLLALHILGIALWIGGLLAAAVTLAQSAPAETGVRAAVAQASRKLMRLLADPGAALAILSGVWLVSFDVTGYFAQRWFQTKLVVVVGLIALHGVLAMRSKRAAAGGDFSAGQSWGLFVAIFIAAVVIVLLSLPGRMVW